MSIKLLNRVTGALAAALIASTAIAADEATNEDEPVMEEIIVSATYRDTRLMDTPLAITAVTAEDMVAKGIWDIQTLYQAIPGLSYQGSIAFGRLTIRGITPPALTGSHYPRQRPGCGRVPGQPAHHRQSRGQSRGQAAPRRPV